MPFGYFNPIKCRSNMGSVLSYTAFCIKNASTIGGTPIIVNVNQNLGHLPGKIRPPFHKKSVIICLLGKSLLKPVAFTIDVQNVRIMVKRSSRAAVICSSPNTSVHLGNSKFVVMIRLPSHIGKSRTGTTILLRFY